MRAVCFSPTCSIHFLIGTTLQSISLRHSHFYTLHSTTFFGLMRIKSSPGTGDAFQGGAVPLVRPCHLARLLGQHGLSALLSNCIYQSTRGSGARIHRIRPAPCFQKPTSSDSSARSILQLLWSVTLLSPPLSRCGGRRRQGDIFGCCPELKCSLLLDCPKY